MKKIFVACRASIGDTLLATPVLRAIKETYPKSQTIFMGSSSTKDLLENHPMIDELIIYEKGNNVIPIIKKIWRSDIALILDFHYRSSFLAWLARIPIRVGRGDKEKIFLTDIVPSPTAERTDIYVVDNMLSVPRYVGINTQNYKLSMPVCLETEEKNVRALLAEYGVHEYDKYVIVAPYSLADLKDWPEEYYHEVILYLKSKGIKTILVGGKEHRSRAKVFSNAINMIGLTNIRETTQLISMAQVVICGCTAVLHFAATTETPQIALYGPTVPSVWAPRQNCTVIEKSLSCRPCYNTGYQCTTDKKCLRDIKPSGVIFILNRLLTL